MAETTPSPELAAAQAAQALAEAKEKTAKAEQSAAEAALARAKAERDLANVEQLASAAQREAQAKADTAVATQQKAVADAQAAAIAADQAATKAQFGTVTANSIANPNITVGAGAGTGEAALLSARSVARIGARIASDLSEKCVNGCVIFSGAARPSLANFRSFTVRQTIITGLFTRAKTDTEAADELWNALNEKATEGLSTKGVEFVGTALTGVGAILDSVAKLGSFFKTEYDIANLTVSADDDLLVASVASGLKGAAYIPGRWLPTSDADSLMNLLKQQATARSESTVRLARAQSRTAILQERAKTQKDDATKAKIERVIVDYAQAIASEQLAQTSYDQFITALATADAAGVPLAAKVIDESLVDSKIKAGASILFLKVHSATGGSYSKKNIWTFFGGMPFFISGGAVASYLLLDKDGKVIISNQLQAHGGYLRATKVQAELDKTITPAR